MYALEQLPPELLYSDMASVVYRGLTVLGIPTKHVSVRDMEDEERINKE